MMNGLLIIRTVKEDKYENKVLNIKCQDKKSILLNRISNLFSTYKDDRTILMRSDSFYSN